MRRIKIRRAKPVVMIAFAVWHGIAVDVVGEVVSIFVIADHGHVGHVRGDRLDLAIEFITKLALILEIYQSLIMESHCAQLDRIGTDQPVHFCLPCLDRSPCRLQK